MNVPASQQYGLQQASIHGNLGFQHYYYFIIYHISIFSALMLVKNVQYENKYYTLLKYSILENQSLYYGLHY